MVASRRQVDVAAALSAQPIQLFALVRLSPIADQIGVRIIGRPWLTPLAAGDGEPLLRQVSARQVVR